MSKKTIVSLGLLLLPALLAHADIPLMVNHQGLAKVDGVPFTGYGLFKFGFVAADDTWLWTNDGTQLGVGVDVAPPNAAVIVAVSNGIYHVRLGDTTVANMVAIPSSAFDDDDVKLRVIFNDGANGEQVLTPDQPLAATPFAYHAANADTLAGRSVSDLLPSGAIMMWAGTTAPEGWVLCDGTAYDAVSDPQFQSLFDAIGVTYGGTGSTDFQVPNMQGRVPVGLDASDVNLARADALGETGGEETHALTESELAPHDHFLVADIGGTEILTSSNYLAKQANHGNDQTYVLSSSDDAGYPPSLAPSSTEGNGDPHENMPPFITLNYIIKR